MIKDFVEKRKNGLTFEKKFYQLYDIDLENSRALEKTIFKSTAFTFQFNFKSKGFLDIISRVFTNCDVFEPRTEKREYYELNEEQFQNCITELFFKMQKYFEK